MSKRSQPDFYTQKAKKEGYRARSVYKLQEIHQKTGLIKPGMTILDVGAYPGGWTQYCLKLLGQKGRVVALDLKALPPFPTSSNLTFLQGDLLTEDIQARLGELGPFDVVVSDAAPSTTGNRLVDTRRSLSLVETIFTLARGCLKEGGKLVIKTFQGGDEEKVFQQMREAFDQVKKLKPKAVRKESFEYYLIGLGYRGTSTESKEGDI